jgi:hypothetical protein
MILLKHKSIKFSLKMGDMNLLGMDSGATQDMLSCFKLVTTT